MAAKGGHKSPLDKARGHEIDWPNVSPLFEAARSLENPSFVYFTGEADNGALKIGVAKDPVQRLRQMQTGNPRRLKVERVLLGNRDIEALFQQMWRHRAIRSPTATNPDGGPGTEWFEPEIREELLPIVDTARDFQIDHVEEHGDETRVLEWCVRQAHGAHDMVGSRPHEVRLLGAGAGYYIPRRVRV